ISFERVAEKNPAATDLLRVCAFFAPDAIPEELFQTCAKHLGPRLSPLGSDPLSLNKALAQLRAYSLIRRNGETKTLSIDRLVQAVLKDAMDEQKRLLWTERVIRAVSRVFPRVWFATWPQCERYLSHALVCADLVEQEEIRSLEAATVLYRVGWCLDDRGRYHEVEPLYKRGLAIRERQLGPTHPHTGNILHSMADLYQHQRKYEQAEGLYQSRFFLCGKI